MELRVFEGFAGYGGASFALDKAGIEHRVVGFSEIDQHAIKLYEMNHKGVKNYGDITQIDADELPDFDLFTGGFPCQPFSSAGLMGGTEDKYGRGNLFQEIIRICEKKQPRFILLENVKGFTSKKFSETFSFLLNELMRIGYTISYSVLNTKDYGIPQNRERLWILATLDNCKVDMSPDKLELKEKMWDYIKTDVDSSLYFTDKQIEHYKEKKGIQTFMVDKSVCFDVYNKKIRYDGICPTIIDPRHCSLRFIEAHSDREVVRKPTIEELSRLMGFSEGQLKYDDISYSQVAKMLGNGWDINLVSILFKHIFSQIEL